MTPQERGELAVQRFHEGYNCCQSVVLSEEDRLPLTRELLAMTASSFGGGIGRLREICGAASGITMVLGMLYGYAGAETGALKAEHYARVQEPLLRFEAEYGSLLCRDLMGFPGKHDTPEPSARTEQYYAARPCADIIRGAAEMLAALIDRAPDYLRLVNKTHLLPEGFTDTPELVDTPNYCDVSVTVEARALAAFFRLQKHMDGQGIQLGLESSLRTPEDQIRIMQTFTERFGADYARRTVAPPYTSEHHTGLALDVLVANEDGWVTENEDLIKETERFAAVHEALPEFGFILRYPQGKEGITGYGYEPWHIRYVGIPAAREIMRRKLTLEEYTEEKNER